MKLIENTGVAGILENSVSYEDLRKEMASIVSVNVNGSQSSQKETSLEKPVVDKVSDNIKLPNGIHDKKDLQPKCNGNINGSCEDASDDEFQLVLESSSDDGGSPLKKNDRDNMSAPQIVQEIEDLLLDINASSVGIDDEIEKELNGTESLEFSDKYEECLVNGENEKTPQEIKDVFEDGDVSDKIENICQKDNFKRKTEAKTPNSEPLECDSPSVMNIVLNEVEIGVIDIIDSRDEETRNVERLPEEPIVTLETLREGSSHYNDIESSTDNIVEYTKPENNEKREENKIQNTDINNDDAMDIDSCIDKEKGPNMPLNATNNDEKVADCKNLVQVNCDIVDNNLKFTTETFKAIDDDTISQSETSNTVVCSSISSFGGEPVRKRNTVEEEQQLETKRPKLENNPEEKKILKRRSSDPVKNDMKRTKLDDSVMLSEPSTEEGTSIMGDGDTEDKSFEEKNSFESTFGKENNDKIHDKLGTNNCDKYSVISTTESRDQSEENSDSNLVEDDLDSNKIDSPELTKSFHSSSKSRHEEPLSCASEVSESEKAIDKSHSVIESTNRENTGVVPSVADIETKGKSTCDSKKGIEVQNCSNSTINSNDKAVILLDDERESCNEIKVKSMARQPKSASSSTAPSENVIGKTNTEIKRKTCVVKEYKDKKTKVGAFSSKENSTQKTEKCKPVSSKSPFDLLTKNMQQAKSSTRKVSISDSASDEDVKETSTTERVLPLLKKFHKDQLENLTRSDLEELVVMKICEAITERSELGQLRLRCQALEQNRELWQKKATQFEKQNKELEMVLKRFLSESALNKREAPNRNAVPIKVTRSVGLQVVLASSVQGALIASKNKLGSEPSLGTSASATVSTSATTSTPSTASRSVKQSQLQQAMIRPTPVEKEIVKDQAKKATFTPPAQPIVNRRGRPSKLQNLSRSSSPAQPSPQASPSKVSPPTTPIKTIAPKPAATSNKDPEVIDLTDKEEKTKAPVGGSIRVAPATQMCFIQQNQGNSPPQQMAAYYVQKPGQRPQQYLVTTASASPSVGVCFNSTPDLQSKAGSNMPQRATPALAVPVYRNGQMIQVQSTPPVVVRPVAATSTPVSPAPRSLPQIKFPSQVMYKHPAPLPSSPSVPSKPGFKAPPPKPQLKIAKTVNGIMLSWSMMLTKDMAEMASYQLYAYQEGQQPPTTSLWKKVGDVKALPLPMACTLTQFIDGHRYHFAVRAVDVHGRIGPFSPPSTILLTK